MGALPRDACPSLVRFDRWISAIWSSALESGCEADEGGCESLAAGGLDNFADNFSAGFQAWLITLQRAENESLL